MFGKFQAELKAGMLQRCPIAFIRRFAKQVSGCSAFSTNRLQVLAIVQILHEPNVSYPKAW